MSDRLLEFILRCIAASVWLFIALVYTVLAAPFLVLEAIASIGRREEWRL
jgi:hypothetical protein